MTTGLYRWVGEGFSPTALAGPGAFAASPALPTAVIRVVRVFAITRTLVGKPSDLRHLVRPHAMFLHPPARRVRAICR